MPGGDSPILFLPFRATEGAVISLVLTFAAAMACSAILTAAVRAVAQWCNIVDCPDGRRKLHRRPVALWGGVAVYISLLAGLSIAGRGSFGAGAELDELAAVLSVVAGIVCLFGAIDDCWYLHARFKLLLQFGAAVPIVAFGYWFDKVVLFGHPIELGWAGVPITVLWLVGCINAINFLDGMDGLASTVGMLTAAMLGIIGVRLGHPHIAAIAVALSGALAGFLVHNLPPARIFLGDSGSMLIGLVVGVLAIQGSMKTSATVAVTVPVAVLSLPILDTFLAVVRRRLTGRSFDSADREHIHHRLLDRGLGPWQALGLIGALCLVTGAAATASIVLGSDAVAWLAILFVVVLAIRRKWFGYHELALARGALARLAEKLPLPRAAPERDRDATETSTTTAARPRRLEPSSAIDFDQAWGLLVEQAQRCGAWRVELWSGGTRPCLRARRWSTAGADESSEWNLRLEYRGADAGRCVLQAAGAVVPPSDEAESLIAAFQACATVLARTAGEPLPAPDHDKSLAPVPLASNEDPPPLGKAA